MMGIPCLLFWLLLEAPQCLTLHLRAEGPSGKDLGEQVGINLRAADEEIAADASQNGEKSDLQGSYAETLTSKEMVLVNPAVSQVIRQTNWLAGSLVERDGLCDRNWEAKCPDGWVLAGSDQCAAPPSYGGACKTAQSFIGKSAAEKKQIADECKAPWPCKDECHDGRDYSELCPEGWSDNSGGFCEAPASIETKCATSFYFAEMDMKTKQELGVTCGFRWKCKPGCIQDFHQTCPEGWNEVPLNPGICTAPATYAGICGFSVNTSSMTSDQKSNFANKCAVKFPCLSLRGAASDAAHFPGPVMPDGQVDPTGDIVSGKYIQSPF